MEKAGSTYGLRRSRLRGEAARLDAQVLVQLLVIALDDETQHRFTTVFRLTLGSW